MHDGHGKQISCNWNLKSVLLSLVQSFCLTKPPQTFLDCAFLLLTWSYVNTSCILISYENITEAMWKLSLELMHMIITISSPCTEAVVLLQKAAGLWYVIQYFLLLHRILFISLYSKFFPEIYVWSRILFQHFCRNSWWFGWTTMLQTLLFGEGVISRSQAALLYILLAVKHLHYVFHDVLTGKLRNKINKFAGF